MFHQSVGRTVRHPWWVGIAAAATAAAGLQVLAPTAGASAAEPPKDPAISLTAPKKTVTESYEGNVFADFGLRLEVLDGPLVIEAQRAADYKSAPETVAKLPGGDVVLPEQKQVGQLQDFLRLRIKDLKNPDATPKVRLLEGCIGETSERTDPAGISENPYPATCAYTPYSLGSVQGVPAGWSSSVLPRFGSNLKLQPGTYEIEASITKTYAAALGVPEDQRTVTTKVVVKKGQDLGCGGDECVVLPKLAKPNLKEPDPQGGIDSLKDLPPGTPTPDLRSLPAFGIGLNKAGTKLTFGATVWNAGNSPLVVDGFRQKGKDVMDAYQYFYDKDDNQVAYQQVGTMEWDPDPTHQHWHFTDFARYELVDVNKDKPVKAAKEAFCLANTDATDLLGESADWSIDEEDLASACGEIDSQTIRQRLAAGWGDTYYQVAGQAISLKNVPDGTYYIRVLANPEGTLIESDTANNESLRKIKIFTNQQGERQVKVTPVGVVEEGNFF